MARSTKVRTDESTSARHGHVLAFRGHGCIYFYFTSHFHIDIINHGRSARGTSAIHAQGLLSTYMGHGARREYLAFGGTSTSPSLSNIQSAVQAYTTLTRDAFAKLTNALQPIYFATSTVLTGTLLGLHLRFHPILVGSPTAAPHWYQTEEGVQAILITTAFLGNLLNWTVVGPNAAGVARERAILEKQTGKAYDANVSVDGSGVFGSVRCCEMNRIHCHCRVMMA